MRGPMEFKNRSVHHKPVFITHVIHPIHLYVQFADRK